MNRNLSQFAQHGQSLWLDHTSRQLLENGALARYITESGISGLTSDPSRYEDAIATSTSYDASIAVLDKAGLAGEDLFFELALEDLSRAADLFRPGFTASKGVDGWVGLAVSPRLADDAKGTIQAAASLWHRAAKANLFVQIPGTAAGIAALEETIFQGIPVNVTLLFSREHYLAAAHAYMRGLERRLAAGLDPKIVSVASLFVSPWDIAVRKQLASPFHNRLGIAVAMRTFKAYCELLASDRWQRLAAAGARPQRLLWVSTRASDPATPDTVYVAALAGAGTIAAISEATLRAFTDHGEIERSLPADGGYAEAVLSEYGREGLDLATLADQLQRDGVAAFATAWQLLLSSIQRKCSIGASTSRPRQAGNR